MILGGESTSHANGGVKYVVKNTGKLIEAEGDEFVFCSEVTKSTRKHTFTGTPYEILIALAKEYNCNVGELQGLNGGEFVICKKVVRDREPLTVSGTPTEIISYLQVEKGCNPHWSYDLEKQDGDICQSCEHDVEKKGTFKYNKEGIAGIEDDGSMAKGGDVKVAKKKVFPSSFKASARFLIDAHYHRTNTTFFGKPYLVHAEVKGSGKFSNQRFGHAWVEDSDLVYNFSRGKVQVYPKAQFYTVADVQTSDSKKYKRYSYEDVAEKLLTSDVYCWDLQTVFEQGGEVMEFSHPDSVVAAPANGVAVDYRGAFQERMAAAQDLAKQLRNAYNGRLQINSDGSITLYHLTGEQVAEKIRENGFRAGAYFFASKSSKYNGDTLMAYRNKHEVYVIMEVHVSPYDVSFSSGTGEFYSELPLKMDSQYGFYKSVK